VDGAVPEEAQHHQGAFHESLNLAKIWRLPVVYICENNQYGMGTDFRRVSAVADLSLMGASYDIPGKQVDGMDVLAVYEEVGWAARRAREEKEPSFLEIVTYRYRGHSMSDPATYRAKEELEGYKRQDPILILRNRMQESGTLSEEEFQALDEECKLASEEAARFAEDSPEPAVETLYEDVLCR
jgi:pyruvate dehydrogenase E1 component alpha subunit